MRKLMKNIEIDETICLCDFFKEITSHNDCDFDLKAINLHHGNGINSGHYTSNLLKIFKFWLSKIS